MYLNHFGLDEAPFSITPDPRFVYLSERHRDGLAHLLYGVGQGGSGGFIQLTGEVGTGKTTLCRLLLEQLPEQTEVALVLNPRLGPVELVETICQELKLDVSDAQRLEAAADGTPVQRTSLKTLVERLNAHLLERHAAGWRVVVLIDEAQDLSAESLEQVRLLTNLETAQQKLLQIILIGQPELRAVLEREDLRQLAQRITARFHLTPLHADETAEYVRHRLAVAGTTRPVFTRLALRSVHRRAGGVPRLINVIADRALLAAFVRGDALVGERAVQQAAREALRGELERSPIRWHTALVGLGLMGCVAAGLWLWSRTPGVVAPEPAAPVVIDVAADTTGVNLGEQIGAAAGQAGVTWQRYLGPWLAELGLRGTPELLQRAQQCPEQIDGELRCLRGSGSLGKLRGLGRPALLRLTDGQHVLPALLTGFEGGQVKLELAGQTLVVAPVDLERYWYGDYLAVWRHPVDIPVTVGEGAGPRAVTYLKDLLLGAGEAPGAGREYTRSVRESVRAVQRRHGLLADGIVGPETWLALSTYDAAGPKLSGLESVRVP